MLIVSFFIKYKEHTTNFKYQDQHDFLSKANKNRYIIKTKFEIKTNTLGWHMEIHPHNTLPGLNIKSFPLSPHIYEYMGSTIMTH